MTDTLRGSTARGDICSYADPRCDRDGDLCAECGRAWCDEHWCFCKAHCDACSGTGELYGGMCASCRAYAEGAVFA